MKDRIGARVDMMAALLAGVSAPFVHRVKLSALIADRAMSFFATKLDFHDALEACGIVRKFLLELLKSELCHGLIPLLAVEE